MIPVSIETLPRGGADADERILVSAKGTMMQILNRTDESFRQVVYWDIDSSRTGADRGHHYHLRKVDRMVVLSGTVDLLLENRQTGERERHVVPAGSRIQIPPGIAHAVRSSGYAQVLEYAPEPYDPQDTHPYRLTEPFPDAAPGK